MQCLKIIKSTGETLMRFTWTQPAALQTSALSRRHLTAPTSTYQHPAAPLTPSDFPSTSCLCSLQLPRHHSAQRYRTMPSGISVPPQRTSAHLQEASDKLSSEIRTCWFSSTLKQFFPPHFFFFETDLDESLIHLNAWSWLKLQWCEIPGVRSPSTSSDF